AMPLGISSVIATSTVKEGFSFLTSLLYSISNFQGADLCDHRIAATRNNISRTQFKNNIFLYQFPNQ
ncbi:hypothetical protein, partial [Laceyella tengchongensis]|uniref:hypothetical protein n=1 Tax=Laceyella tengchongensis TaxID=574699 RepID=UPI001E5E41BF